MEHAFNALSLTALNARQRLPAKLVQPRGFLMLTRQVASATSIVPFREATACVTPGTLSTTTPATNVQLITVPPAARTMSVINARVPSCYLLVAPVSATIATLLSITLVLVRRVRPSIRATATSVISPTACYARVTTPATSARATTSHPAANASALPTNSKTGQAATAQAHSSSATTAANAQQPTSRPATTARAPV